MEYGNNLKPKQASYEPEVQKMLEELVGITKKLPPQYLRKIYANKKENQPLLQREQDLYTLLKDKGIDKSSILRHLIENTENEQNPLWDEYMMKGK